jgi:uncharacterized C2H2 Zn-finger protein
MTPPRKGDRHGARRWTCPWCNKVYREKDDLDRHLAQHREPA